MPKTYAQYPLLRRLTTVQLVALCLLIAIVCGVVTAMAKVQRVAYESQIKELVAPRIQADQERWRTWASLGLKDALSKELRRVKAALPVNSLSVVRRDELSPSSDATRIVVPEEDDGVSPYVVVASFGTAGWSSMAHVDNAMLLALAAALLAFLGVVLYSNFFIRTKIYKPISKVNHVLTQCDGGRREAMTRVAAVGEIRVFVDNIVDLYDKATQAETHAAIARMTGMLAHDVRKPFSILRMGLGMLNNAKDPAGVKRILTGLVPEIDKAVSSVDGLIADVMEVGSTSTEIIQEPASPESLIEATLGEIFRVYPKADITVDYELRHASMVNVHVQKVGRVFSNIVGNAVQAVNGSGGIWFKTRERDGMVEFCLGNAGSVIPQESLPKLFDAFFTSGKKGGTGLGLAIAKKVVTAHGGRIWCESSKTSEHPNGKVEFLFTLPVALGMPCRTTAKLPEHSSEITKSLEAIAPVGTEGSVDKGELTLEAEIIQVVASEGRPIRVLVVDDEAVYRSALVNYLSRTTELGAAVAIHQASGATAALQMAAQGLFDLVITDVDMGPECVDGFELVRRLRAQKGSASLICVHSNRMVPADQKTALESGSDAFIPKPIARGQLLKLVLQSARATTVPKTVTPSSERAASPEKPTVLVVDDNQFILEAWADTLKPEAKVVCLASYEALKARLSKEPDFVDRLALVITDMHIDGSAGDGLDVGRLIKGLRAELPVLLSSDGKFAPAELGGVVDAVIGKDPVALASLARGN